MSDRSSDLPDLGALAPWAPELAKTFVSLSSDIALVIDAQGVIRNVVQGDADPLAPGAYEWVGRPWVDTVSRPTRSKIENLLYEVATTGIARRREVEHPLQQGVSIPVAYSAIRFGADGPVLATGRDLRAIAAIQQRFLESQHEMERGYWHARQAETRYRLLFQVATDAVLVVDARTLRIVEANQAATRVFDLDAEQLADRAVTIGFAERSRGAVEELMIRTCTTGQPGEVQARLLGSTLLTSVAATPFRADDELRLLVRVRAVDGHRPTPSLSASLAQRVEGSNEGVVVTDSQGGVLMANRAFLKLVRVNDESELRGQPITDWLGVPEHPVSTLLPRVRRDGLTHKLRTWVKVAHVPVARVEISAALLTEGDQACIGFTVHGIDGGAAPASGDRGGAPDELQHLLLQLASRLGQAPLSDLVADAAGIAERHLVAAALARANDDEEQAAALLGIGRERLALLQAAHGAHPGATPHDGGRR